MVAVYRDGKEVVVNIPYVDSDGTAVTPVSAEYRIYDELGTEIVATTPIAIVPLDTSVDITVAAASNLLGVDQYRTVRTVETTLTLAEGSITKISRYVIEAPVILRTLINSYQSYGEAELNAMDLPDLSGWESKAERQRTAALIDAHDRLGKMVYEVGSRNDGSQSHLNDSVFAAGSRRINGLNELTQAEFDDLPLAFIKALKKAQIVEADVILNGDVIGDQRRVGLMSQTIGEVSQMFRPGKPLLMPVSAQALRYLQGYVSFSVNTSRR